MFEVYLGIGSNIGDSKMHLKNCVEALNLNIGKVSHVSSMHVAHIPQISLKSFLKNQKNYPLH